MIRSLAAILTLAAGWSFTDLSLDRLRWNARERTAVGLEVLETHRRRDGIEAFETAARLDPDDPILRFNAGSAHLVAGTGGALEHLERAAEFAPDELRAAANYNLGNARLAADDTAGAIAAYEQTLRVSPDHQAAKFNLELALERQQQQQEQDEKDRKPQEQQPSDNRHNDREQEQQQDSNEPEQNGRDQQEQEQEQDENERSQQLPRFEEQPDMTAEQAAAILEAVENLERAQRRKQAEEQMKKRAHKGKDW